MLQCALTTDIHIFIWKININKLSKFAKFRISKLILQQKIGHIFQIFFQNIKLGSQFLMITWFDYLSTLNFKTLSFRNIMPYVLQILYISKKTPINFCLIIWNLTRAASFFCNSHFSPPTYIQILKELKYIFIKFMFQYELSSDT